MKTIAISQPTYLPWSGYFSLLNYVDVFVLLDDVQYVKRSWQNQNKIKSPDGWIWLSIPTHSHRGDLIIDVKIDNTKPWKKTHWKSIVYNYGRAPYFNEFSPFFKSIYQDEWINLVDINIAIIKHVSSILGVNTILTRSSELDVKGKRTQMLLEVCKKLDAERYVSSIGAKDYLIKDNALELFKENHIDLRIFQYQHPIYPQLFGDFISHLSVIDCIFNCGSGSKEILLDPNLRSFSSIEDISSSEG